MPAEKPSPDNPTTLFSGLDAGLRASAIAATRLLQSGQAEAARRRLERLLPHAPTDADLLRLTGMAQRHCGRLLQAKKTLERARKAAPRDPLVASGLGLACLAAGHEDEGLAELERACRLAPQAAALWNNYGKALIDCDHVADAIEPLHTALELQADFYAAGFSLAYALTVTGQVDAAARQYRQLLQQRPADGEAWMGLAQLKSGLLDEADVVQMQELLAEGHADEGDRIALGFALGQALHDQGRHTEAFASWQAANAALHRRKPWDSAAFSARVDAALSATWPVPDKPTSTPRVVFIVGLPRSGTSLTECILAMHGQVFAGGELDVLPRLLHEVTGGHVDGLSGSLAGLDRVGWQRLGDAYLQRARQHAGDQPVLTDKRPGNWLFAGAALAMLPDARIVVCRRDPVEVCFSCWRQRFSYDNQRFANDFKSLAAHWHDFDRASRHWRARYPERVMDFSYEGLLDDPERSIRELLAFCGLPFEPDCLYPERGTGVVRTLSTTQVRKPLRKGSAVASRYGELLDPLRCLLAKEKAGSA